MRRALCPECLDPLQWFSDYLFVEEYHGIECLILSAGGTTALCDPGQKSLELRFAGKPLISSLLLEAGEKGGVTADPTSVGFFGGPGEVFAAADFASAGKNGGELHERCCLQEKAKDERKLFPEEPSVQRQNAFFSARSGQRPQA